MRGFGQRAVRPLGGVLDGEDVVLNTGSETVKGRNLARDSPVSLCVDDERPPYAMVVLRGGAELSEDPAELLVRATRIAARRAQAESVS
jgi:hypothetical protein